MYDRTVRTHRIINRLLINPLIILLIIFHVNIAGGAEEKILENVKSYIHNIRSAAISFQQTDLKGATAAGILVIDKPHKFRVNYFRPFPLLIVGNKNYISIYDYEMENMSRIEAKDNIFNFLLVDKTDFASQFKVISAQEIKGHDQIRLAHLESGKVSDITFDRKSQNIVQIKIYEDDNEITLKFAKTQKLVKVNHRLFVLQDPDIFGKPEYLDEGALQKNYQQAS